MKGLGKHIMNNGGRIMEDIDFHDLMNMMNEGMSQNEIARELGVSNKVVEWIRQEIEKDV